MATAKKATPTSRAKKSVAKKKGRGGFREGAGGVQLVPNKVRKTVDIPGEIADKIIKSGSDVSAYMRKATYNQMVSDGMITQTKCNSLTNYRKRASAA